MPRPVSSSPSRRVDLDVQRESARQQAATRRAIVLGTLTGLLLVTLVAAFLGFAPKWAPIVMAIPVVGFVVAAAMTAAERTSARPAKPVRSARRTDRVIAADGAAEVPVLDQSEEEWENWNAWDDEDSWEAVPTTLPTYVDAPRASAVPRGIDRDTPGEWTGSAMVETAQAMRRRSASAPLPDASQIDHGALTAEIPVVRDDLDTRRAVNE